MKAGMSTVRLCQLFDMPERTWRRWQAKARRDTDPRLPSRNNGGDDHNNDGTDPELERPRDQPSETIDEVRQVNEELPSHYTGEHAEIGKTLNNT